MRTTYRGSCHCGAIHFDADIDLAQGTSRCNCSICGKSRFWKAIVPAHAFRLRRGEADLSTYRFASRTIRHRFCRHCGIKPFGEGHMEGLGDFVAVNLACLDDVSPRDLAAAPVAFENGRHDDWANAPAEHGHL